MLLSACAAPPAARATADAPVPVVALALRYTIAPDTTDWQSWRVSLEVRETPDTLRLHIPIWAPGAYRVAEFQRRVRDVSAVSDGRALAIARPDSSTWVVASGGAPVTIAWRVQYTSALGASSANNRSFLTPTGGLIDGPGTWLYPADGKARPARVRVDVPAGWTIATGLVRDGAAPEFQARDIDVLLDSPILVGRLRTWDFVEAGIPHEIAWWPAPDAATFDTSAFVAMTARIVRAGRDLFGGYPYARYVFLGVDGAGGGLEHLNSTTLGLRSGRLARDPAAYAGLVAHEYFHLWNVKRLRPVELGPFDYQRIVRSPSLWFSEGVTEWGSSALLRRAGLQDSADARATFEAALDAWQGNPAVTRLSPERSSYTAWDPDTINAGDALSYYTQGEVLGELLDLALRARTNGRATFADVMRRLYAAWSGPRGFTPVDVWRAVDETCGCALSPVFRPHVEFAAPLPLASLLASAGWQLVADAGAETVDRRIGVVGWAGYGSAGGEAGGPIRLRIGYRESAWAKAGLRSGDELLAVDGARMPSPEAFGARIARVEAGDVVRMTVRRGTQELVVPVTVGTWQPVRFRLRDLPVVSPEQRAIRDAWARGR